MATYNSQQMTYPMFPMAGPTGDGRSIQEAGHGTFVIGTQSTGALASGDVLRMFRIHRNTRVSAAAVKWDALGAGVTIALGDAGNATRYMAATSAATAGSSTALADTGRDYLNTVQGTPILVTIGGATTNATGTITAVLHGIIENPA
jgi:hypothetical protein